MPIIVPPTTVTPGVNVKFGTYELASIGLSVHDINGREMAQFVAERVAIPGSDQTADLSGRFDPTTTTELTGSLSSPTDNWSLHTRAELLSRLASLKTILDPEEKGYQKLIITADQATLHRWARYADMKWVDKRPAFKKPFEDISLTFDNLEPFWRKAATPVSVPSTSAAIPNTGKRTKPRITIPITTDILTLTGLFLFDGLGFYWNGGVAPLLAGDLLTIDSETLTAQYQTGGTGPFIDGIRGYQYDSALNNGFPSIAPGGSALSAKSPLLGTLTVSYDEKYT